MLSCSHPGLGEGQSLGVGEGQCKAGFWTLQGRHTLRLFPSLPVHPQGCGPGFLLQVGRRLRGTCHGHVTPPAVRSGTSRECSPCAWPPSAGHTKESADGRKGGGCGQVVTASDQPSEGLPLRSVSSTPRLLQFWGVVRTSDWVN